MTNWTSDGCLVGPLEGGDDAHEVAGLERGAADEAAVDVGLREQFRRVLGVHAAAVKDADSTGGTGAVDLADHGTDAFADFTAPEAPVRSASFTAAA